MELESIFTDSKWRIITELSHNSLSPTNLAKKTGTSLPNISTQLKLLEALDFVEKNKLNNVGKGNPRKIYSLKKECAYVIVGTKNAVGKRMIKLNSDSKFFFSSLLISEQKAGYLLVKLFFQEEDLFRETITIGFIGKSEGILEILIISENTEKYQILNNKKITSEGKEYGINAHIHSKDAFVNGINNNDTYFKSILHKVFILWDKENFMSNLKKGGT